MPTSILSPPGYKHYLFKTERCQVDQFILCSISLLNITSRCFIPPAPAAFSYPFINFCCYYNKIPQPGWHKKRHLFSLRILKMFLVLLAYLGDSKLLVLSLHFLSIFTGASLCIFCVWVQISFSSGHHPWNYIPYNLVLPRGSVIIRTENLFPNLVTLWGTGGRT